MNTDGREESPRKDSPTGGPTSNQDLAPPQSTAESLSGEAASNQPRRGPATASSSLEMGDSTQHPRPAVAAKDLPCAPREDAELLAAIDEIDYAAYEDPKLRDSIEAILSVPGTVLFFLRVVVLTYPICELLIVWTFSDKGWLTWGVAVVAGLIASAVFAVLLGVTLCLRRIANEIVNVIDTTLTIVSQITADLGATGDQGILTTTACVFGAVSRNLILPIVESVVQSQLGFFGRPLLWVYRRVFVKAVDVATNRILLAASKIRVPGQQHLAPATERVGASIKSGAQTADWLLATVRPYVIGGTRALTLGILIPAWILLGGTTAAIVAVFWVGYQYG